VTEAQLALDRLAAEETFQDTEGLIVSTINDFHVRYGGDRDEQRSKALELFCLTRRSYDREVAEFTTYLRFRIWKGLLEELRTTIGRDRRLTRVYTDLDQVELPSEFDLDEFCSRLTPAATAVVKLLFDPPLDMVVELGGRDWGGVPGTRIRSALTRYLKDLGLKSGMIRDIFTEIRGKL
jgi:hypothetical protein